MHPSPATPKDATEVPGIEEPIGRLEATGRPTGEHGDRYLDATVAASRLRPLARRRFRMARPDFVFIRARNPCFRSRLIRLGWYVRFIAADPHSLAVARSRFAVGGRRRWLPSSRRTPTARPPDRLSDGPRSGGPGPLGCPLGCPTWDLPGIRERSGCLREPAAASPGRSRGTGATRSRIGSDRGSVRGSARKLRDRPEAREVTRVPPRLSMQRRALCRSNPAPPKRLRRTRSASIPTALAHPDVSPSCYLRADTEPTSVPPHRDRGPRLSTLRVTDTLPSNAEPESLRGPERVLSGLVSFSTTTLVRKPSSRRESG